jgi:adenosylcobinamide-phosphate synthase
VTISPSICIVITALTGGIGLDYLLGDPSNRYHPVAWLGRIIEWSIPRLKGRSEKAKGAIFAVILVVAAGSCVNLLICASTYLAGALTAAIASSIILKIAIAVKGMERHAKAIMACIEAGDLESARYNLSMIVRRKTDGLDEQHILSATIECISESTVDGIASPLFYYSIFGPGGAFAYRTINTLDSMVGYKNHYYKDIGWMSARLDTITNYLPARITALLMIASAKILGADWRNSLYILNRDHSKTFSPNAGYPMATMAGALRVRLEKIGHYTLGDEQEMATLEKCKIAISIMKLTTLLFCLAISLPTISILYLAGGNWWRIILGTS